MKKIKYRNNNYNNQVYSINYKFDSISPAGKCCGTALDLIKRYNELAKEAQSNGNFVEAEVFRQYAEHYRKIVTDINERKNARFNTPRDNSIDRENAENETNNEGTPETKEVAIEIETSAVQTANAATENENNSTFVETKPKATKKAFTVIEVADEAKPKRVYKPRNKKEVSA